MCFPHDYFELFGLTFLFYRIKPITDGYYIIWLHNVSHKISCLQQKVLIVMTGSSASSINDVLWLYGAENIHRIGEFLSILLTKEHSNYACVCVTAVTANNFSIHWQNLL